MHAKNGIEVSNQDMMEKEARIFVAGHKGLVGSAIVRQLNKDGYSNILLRSRSELDLTDQAATDAFFAYYKPDYVFLAAAKVGGICANMTYPADFIFDNIIIQANAISAAHRNEVKKLLFLGSSCIYPRLALQPMREEYLLTGELEPTNEPYAIAKIAGIKMCEAYRKQYGDNYVSVMPTNLFGINDSFDLVNCHVLPALIRKFHEATMEKAPTVTIWGSGKSRREFMFVDDLAEACVFLMNNYNEKEIINVGTGMDLTISELACMVSTIVGYKGEIVYDFSKPDGMPQKLLDVSKINKLGWKSKTPLYEGIKKTYEWYKSHCP